MRDERGRRPGTEGREWRGGPGEGRAESRGAGAVAAGSAVLLVRGARGARHEVRRDRGKQATIRWGEGLSAAGESATALPWSCFAGGWRRESEGFA